MASGFNDARYLESVVKDDEVQRFLDSRIDREKLDAMKRLVAMISVGRDVSRFFPDVVKNVFVKNLEIKKLVYMFLMHYAETKPDTALLAINTFQKEMADKNPFTRALALRVMSSIRVPIIVPIVILAIKKCSKDSSSYVRKTAANAISKVYSLDQEQKETLIDVIEHLLKDGSTTVLGSAAAAFTEVCPDRWDLLHPAFRKLCHLLPDTDEWGQIAIMNTLLRYARTQFLDPNAKVDMHRQDHDAPFYSDEEDKKSTASGTDEYEMDPDHRLFLKSALPLLHNRNTGVVLAVATVYYYLAPIFEAQQCARALVRIVHSPREIQYVVLVNIASMAAVRPRMFETYVRDFFVHETDPSFTWKLKLDILSNIANEGSISAILREFQYYVKHPDKEFVTATIQAIGRVASRLPDVANTCLQGLISLVHSKSELVVGESVVVIRELLQKRPERHDRVIAYLAHQLDKIRVPTARASIIWVVGEYIDKIPLIAPDTLRVLATTFAKEDVIVKLQILTLGCKLHLKNPEQTTPLFRYILDLAKFDTNFDVRDRARFMRRLLIEGAGGSMFHAKANGIFLSTKPMPKTASPFEDRQRFILNSISHVLNHAAFGYQALSDWPAEQPDPSVRNPPEFETEKPKRSRRKKEKKHVPLGITPRSEEDSFYSEEGGSAISESYSSYSDESFSEGESFQSASYESGSWSGSGSASPGSGSSYGSGSESGSEPEEEKPPPPRSRQPPPTKERRGKTSSQDASGPGVPQKDTSKGSLIDLDIAPEKKSTPMDDLATAFGSVNVSSDSSAPLVPSLAPPTRTGGAHSNVPVPGGLFDSGLRRYPLLKRTDGGGLGIEFQFSRQESMHSRHHNVIRVFLTNHLDQPITSIRVGNMPTDSAEIIPFYDIPTLDALASVEVLMHIDFSQSTQPVKFEIRTDRGIFPVTINVAVGELFRPAAISEEEFSKRECKISGMHELTAEVVLTELSKQLPRVVQNIVEVANVATITANASDGIFRFAGQGLRDDMTLLISVTIDMNTGSEKLKVNCDNTIFGSRLMAELKAVLAMKQ